MNFFKCENSWLLKQAETSCWIFTSWDYFLFFLHFSFPPDFVFRVQHDVKFSHLQKTFFAAKFYSAVSWLSVSLLSCVIRVCVCV